MTASVLVTGGSGGIGSAVCRRFAEAGMRPLVGFAANRSKAEMVARECDGTAIPLDLTSQNQIADAIDIIERSEDKLAGVVMCASPPPVVAPVFRQPADELDRQLRIVLQGHTALLDGAVRRLMRPAKQGQVVFVLSEAMGIDDKAAKSMGPYIIAKYGLLGLSKVIEAEYSWLGVHRLFPGFTETDMLNVFDSRFLDQLRTSSPNGRFPTAGEVADDIWRMFEGT